MKFEKAVALLRKYQKDDAQVTVEIRNAGGGCYEGEVAAIDPKNDVVTIIGDSHYDVTISDISVIVTDRQS